MSASAKFAEPLEEVPISPRWLPVTAVAAFILSILPVLIWYARRATDGSDEPLGVIALLVAVFTLAVAAHYGKRDQDRIRVLPLRMLVGAALLAIVQFNDMLRFPLLAGLFAIVVIAVSVHMPHGKAGFIALLVLSLPLVASLDFFAGYPLRLAAAEITVGLLNLGGVSIEQAGVMLIDGNSLVGIDPPCAGIRMLWTACFVAAVLAARMRLSWPRTSVLLASAIACVIIGNGVRAAVVFFPESGRVEWPGWAHPGVGLVVHGCVLGAIFSIASRLDRIGNHITRYGMHRLAIIAFGIFIVFSGIVANGLGTTPDSDGPTAWPTMLDGIALIRQRLSPMEQSFSRSFPGEIAKFTWGDAEVIMRRSHKATRMMHPSGDCLRAAGYETHSEPVFRDSNDLIWGASYALRNGKRWTVHERYVSSSGDACTDASAWFWKATLHPEEGPWTATTVIRPSN